MIEITCPACGGVHRITPPGDECQLPFKCPSCLGLYLVSVKDGAPTACEPLTEAGYARLEQARQGHKHII